MSIVVYQDVATPIVPIEGLAGRVREALGGALQSMRYVTPDFAGLYQDAAGTTPVTAVGQPVGLMLDRRFGLERGVEQISNGDFSQGDSGWATGGPGVVAYADGAVSITATGGNTTIVQNAGMQAGKTYEVVLEITAVTDRVLIRDFSGLIMGIVYGPGTHRVIANHTHANGHLLLTVPEGHVATITGVSLREVPGNHASQTTTTARPTLRSGPLRIDYDGVDDYLRTVFPDLGSDVTIARSIPGVGAQILTGQTIAAGDWDDNVTSCATLVIDRALTGPETALVSAFLNQQAGV